MVFHSLLPYGVNGNDEATFNKAFVKLVQEGNMQNINLPNNVVFINSNNSKLTDDFWNDLKLDDADEGLKINFKKKNIN